MAAQTENSRLKVTSPLGDDTFLLHTVQAREALCRPFRYELDLYSLEKAISPGKLLGEPMTAHLALPDGKFRYYNGLVARFERKGGIRSGHAGNYMHYEAVLVPAIWFLQKTADCRIFQEMTAPEIIKEIFRKHAFLKFDESLFGEYRKRIYTVQYRETDANFVHRLMEEEGIYYRFEHTDSDHTLILCDSPSSHDPFPGYEEIEFYAMAETDDTERECISNWQASYEVQTGTYAHKDYDFEIPAKDLLKQKNIPKTHSISEMEFYDYPGRYIEPADGETYARVRIEEQHAKFERLEGEGSARGLQVGSLFTLAKHDQDDQNREYLIVNMEHSLYEELPFETGLPAAEARLFDCHFNAMVSDVPYRPPCITERPTVKGPQTAVVVGKSGEEIWTDDHGRVKVQFHWDRYGNFDENSSCWIRVSQVHAGKGFGGVDIPRIGEEVIVECLEGDPDCPMITGRVYNGNNKPPTGLPAAGMVSGLKSNSTPGGGGDNAIMLDDSKGKEGLNTHAQYNMNTAVGNNQDNTVGVDQSNTVGSNQKEKIGANREINIGSNDNVSVEANRDISIGANNKVLVGANRDTSIGANNTVTVSGNDDVNISGKSSLQVGGTRTETIGGSHTIVNPRMTITTASQYTVAAGSMFTGTSPKVNMLAGSKFLANSGGKMDMKAGAALNQQSGAAMNIKSGASLKMQSSATMSMKSGATIKSNASGSMNLKAGGTIKGKGSQIKLNSPTKIKGTTLTVK